MTTALEICQAAYNEANPGQRLTSFSGQSWPNSLALQLLNKVISEINKYSFWFMETDTLLPYTPGNFTYKLADLNINPQRIVKMQAGDGILLPRTQVFSMNHYDYRLQYPDNSLSNVQPDRYTRYGGTLQVNSAPQQDYLLTVSHYAYIPKMQNENSILPVPFEYEHVFQDGVNAQLLLKLSREDAATAYKLWVNKIENLAEVVDTDYGMPTQLPAQF